MTTVASRLDELLAELALTRLGHEVIEAVEAKLSSGRELGAEGSRFADFVASLIADLYDDESTSEQNRLRLTSNLEMTADRLLVLAHQLRSAPARIGDGARPRSAEWQ